MAMLIFENNDFSRFDSACLTGIIEIINVRFIWDRSYPRDVTN